MRLKKPNKEDLKFWGKVHVAKEEIVVGICDANLLGKKLIFNGVEIKISKRFFKGKKIDEEQALKLMEIATIGNLFGKEIIKLAAKAGFIDKKNIIKINEVPHAQFVKL